MSGDRAGDAPAQEEKRLVNIDELESTLEYERDRLGALNANASYIACNTLAMIEELRQMRAERERQRAAGMRRQYTVTDGSPPTPHATPYTRDQAVAELDARADGTTTIWQRDLYPGAWYPTSDKPY